MAKARDIISYLSLLLIAIVSGILTIAEKFTSFGLMSWAYPVVGQSNTLYLLAIIVFASFLAYLFEIRRRASRGLFEAVTLRPTKLDRQRSYDTKQYDVKWACYPPASSGREAWIEGPYCPRCRRELEEAKSRKIIGKRVWECPTCDRQFDRPKEDAKEQVRKDFEAYLRRKRVL